MRDETISQEQSEEIIDLLDIVASPEKASEPESPESEDRAGDALKEEGICEESGGEDTELSPQAHSCPEKETLTAPAEGTEPLQELEPENAPEILSAAAEEDLLPKDAELVSCPAEDSEIPTAEGRIPEEEAAQDLSEALGAPEPEAENLSELGEAPCPAEESRETFEARCERKLHELEQRLFESEKARDALAAQVEALQQQLVDAGSVFLEDARVRLHLEELVSRMMDAREGEPALPAERLEALEERMKNWEEQADKKMMQAAAHVIREEIAAMRAEAKNSGKD